MTLTTVGFGDITPHTATGQTLAALLMILGYGIIAVPTGIVTAEMVSGPGPRGRACTKCGIGPHDLDARHCKYCGTELPD